MIDVFEEHLVTLRDACHEQVFRHPKTKKASHISKLHRMVMIGARATNGDRVKLEVVKTPSGLRTSREAISRFILALTDPDLPVEPRSRSARQKHIASAEAELTAAGFDVGGSL